MRLHTLPWAVATVVLTVGLGPAAHAGFSPFNVGTGSEPDLLTILDSLYGLENLERIHDFGVDRTDQIWSNHGTVTVTAVAKFANFSQTFGLFTGAEGGEHVELFTVEDDFGMLATPPSAAFTVDISGSVFRRKPTT